MAVLTNTIRRCLHRCVCVCVCVVGEGEYPLYAVNILVMVMHIFCIMTKQRTLRILFLLLHLYYDAFEH